jgi:hypothetical protein
VDIVRIVMFINVGIQLPSNNCTNLQHYKSELTGTGAENADKPTYRTYDPAHVFIRITSQHWSGWG